MHFIIGGAYQGKLALAKRLYNFTDDQIFTCQDPPNLNIDFSRPCVNHIERYALACTKALIDPIDLFIENKDLIKNSVLICCEIGSGLIPITPEERLWRENTGRLSQFLAINAYTVSRVFCGLEYRLK